MGLTDFLEKHRANKAKKQNKSSPAATTSPSNENSIVVEKESHSSSSSSRTTSSSISSRSMSSKSSSVSSNDSFSSSSSNESSTKSSETASGPRSSKKIKKSSSQDANSTAKETASKELDLDDERSDTNTSTNTTTHTSKQDQDQDNSEPNTKETSTAIVQKHPQEYLPKYLHRYVQHSHGDFFISHYFDPRLIATLMYEGFLPIATPNYLVPKLHKERCVIYPLHSSSGSTVHISKNVKKRSKKFTLTCNQSFRNVVQGCHDQHGISWLYPPIVNAFETILENTSLLEPHQTNTFPVTFYTVEVWNLEGDLVGGELGYAFGTIYTSLTGFSKEDNAGSVQLAALGQFLWEQGFEMWDLGMELEYKQRLGARNMPRHEFVQTVKELRDKDTLLLKLDEPKCCKEMIVNASRSESGC